MRGVLYFAVCRLRAICVNREMHCNYLDYLKYGTVSLKINRFSKFKVSDMVNGMQSSNLILLYSCLMIGTVQHLNYRMCVKFSMMKMVLFLECDPKKNKTSDVPGVCFLELHSRGLGLIVWKGPLPSWGHRCVTIESGSRYR